MKKMKLYLGVLGICFLGTVCFAEEDYIECTIVTNRGVGGTGFTYVDNWNFKIKRDGKELSQPSISVIPNGVASGGTPVVCYSVSDANKKQQVDR